MSCYEVLLSLDCFGSSSILLVFRFAFKKEKNSSKTYVPRSDENSQFQKENKRKEQQSSSHQIQVFKEYSIDWGWGTLPTMPVARIASEGLLQM